ncbi:cobalamin synthase [Clavibacter michiganensis]|uniref:hypothetical protein n=1 Tax=Clavibacter michiganensis TaxID=28447 RepID=UPI001AE9688E|nr:hypothetical protein [Clavibacter michiganensis]MBP2457627.1 cobalamin synthase [Clavibacter michiganensis]MDQ0410197.1 cobalamin synthase [Clavibacter michiganensis]
MAPSPRTTFRDQAEGALAGFAGIVTYLLFQVARRTEVRTEGDRVLVVVCTIGAGATGAVLLVLLVRGAVVRRRERVAAAERASVPRDEDPGDRPGT